MRLALYEPDIPQNTGTIMRLCACLDVALDIIEPCGFILNDRHLKRAGMDYLDLLDMTRHESWNAFRANCETAGRRIVLMTTKTETPYTSFDFRADDILLAGRESAGVPETVHEACAARVTIPMAAQARSINVAMSCAMVLGEALRQTGDAKQKEQQDRQTRKAQ